MHLFQNRGRGRNRQSTAPIIFRDQGGEITGVRERLHELGRILALAVERTPVVAREFCAKRAHALADVGIGVLGFAVLDHGTASSPSCPACAGHPRLLLPLLKMWMAGTSPGRRRSSGERARR